MKLLPLLALFILFLSSCQEPLKQVPIIDTGAESPPGLDCILITGTNGAPLGTYPEECDPLGQWIQSNLNTEELKILDFPDTISTPLAASLKIRRAFAYPNPVALNEPLYIGFNGMDQHIVKIKLAVVNASTQTVQQLTFLSDGSDTIALNISSNRYNPGAYYRVYFQVIGDREEIFIEGHGNIFICNNASVDNVEDCF